MLIKCKVIIRENSSLPVPVTPSLTVEILPDLASHGRFCLNQGCPTGFRTRDLFTDLTTLGEQLTLSFEGIYSVNSHLAELEPLHFPPETSR